MTYVVTDNCIMCKYTDCVEVCPVDCFYEGENTLVIQHLGALAKGGAEGVLVVLHPGGVSPSRCSTAQLAPRRSSRSRCSPRPGRSTPS